MNRVSLVLLLVLTGGNSAAAPLLESRVGGLMLIGPALDHPASSFLNPASLSLLPGTHVYLDGTLRLGVGSVKLQTTDPNTGRSVPGTAHPDTDLREMFPQMFLTASSDLGLDLVTLAITLHTPYAYRFSYLVGGDAELFDPAQQWSGRSQAVDMTLYSLFVTPSAAFRVFDKLSLGFSFSYVFVQTDFGFVRDAALEGGLSRNPGEVVALDDCGGGIRCGYGADPAAEAVRIRGHANALAFSAGVLLRPHPKVDVGAAYHSRVVGWSESDVSARGDAWVRRSQASMVNAASDPALASGLTRDLDGRGTITFSLPDMVNVGSAWRVTDRLLLDLQFRWINFSAHDKLDVRLSGTQFRARPQVPDSLVHFRGFQDVFAVQAGASFRLTPGLVLQGASMVETAAVPSEAVSPAAVDNTKVDSFVAVRWLLGRGFSVHAGYGLVLMPSREVSRSTYSPDDMVACVEARYDVDRPECQRSAAGQALASAAGQYRLAIHRFGIGLAYDLW